MNGQLYALRLLSASVGGVMKLPVAAVGLRAGIQKWMGKVAS